MKRSFKNFKMGKSITALMIFTTLFITNDLYSFKINTHIYVGNEVLKDLSPDSKVSIPPYGEFEVSTEVYEALINNPDEYRMGNAAPDGLPDLMAGQMLVHPGMPGDWSTDDWLKWVMKQSSAGNPQTKAFAYGYISHAAADVFSHTYVNMYSGAFYLLTDGIEEEMRHLALEGYIVNHTPPLTNNSGNIIGECHDVINAPVKFITENLIRNDTVLTRHHTSLTTKHLAGMYELEKLQNNLLEKIEEINSIIYLNPDGIYAYTRKLSELKDKILEAEKKITEDTLDLEKIDKALKAQELLIEQQQKLVSASAGRLQKINAEISEVENNLVDAYAQLAKTEKYLTRTIINALTCIYYPCPTWKKPHKKCKKCPFEKITERYLNPDWLRLDTTINQYIARKAILIDKKKNEIAIGATEAAALTALEIEKTDLMARRKTIVASLDAGIKLKNELVEAQTRFDHLLEKLFEYIAMLDNAKVIIENWKKDVISADEKYVAANAEFIKNIINKNKSDKFEPVTNWITTNLPVYTGVPSEALTALNKVVTTLKDVKAVMDKIDPLALVMEEVKEKTKEVAIDFARNASKDTTKEIIDMLCAHEKSDQKQNMIDIFSKDSSSKRLLVIPDIADRLDKDMHLDANGNFDPLLFRPLYNSVTLAKMALLSGSELNRLVEAAAKTNPDITIITGLYGSDNSIFPENDISFNILFDWIKSIDGNHQWQQKAVPIPRKDDNGNPGYFTMLENELLNWHGHAYDAVTKTGGLRIWQEEGARKAIFNVIFHGPLNESIETPALVGLNEILGAEYPWRGIPENPFPDSGIVNYSSFLTGKYIYCSLEQAIASFNKNGNVNTVINDADSGSFKIANVNNDDIPESIDKSVENKDSSGFSCGSPSYAAGRGQFDDGFLNILFNLLLLVAVPFTLLFVTRKLKKA